MEEVIPGHYKNLQRFERKVLPKWILCGILELKFAERGKVMNKSDIIEFFDCCAPQWDAEMVRSDEIIGKILDGAEVEPGKDILDVACGTGVLIPDYLKRRVASVIGVDISPEMIHIAESKFCGQNSGSRNLKQDQTSIQGTAQEQSGIQASIQGQSESGKVSFICGDVETVEFAQKFDCIVIYNAFPHFPDPEHLIHTLAGYLKPGGTLTVAHGMSRARIDRHHEGAASKVSRGLMHEDELAKIFERDLEVIVKISDESMYQVTGIRDASSKK